MTFKPYRREVVEAVDLARRQGVLVIALSDSPASPILSDSEVALLVNTETPQFFPSTVAAIALLETVMAFVVARAGPSVIENIDDFHRRRQALGLYVEEPA